MAKGGEQTDGDEADQMQHQDTAGARTLRSGCAIGSTRRAESRLGHARQCIRSIILKRPSDQVAVSKGIYPSQLAVCGYLGRKARAQ